MKKFLSGLLMVSLTLSTLIANGTRENDLVDGIFPAGKISLYAYGNPEFRKQYFEDFLSRNRDIAPEVEIEMVSAEGEADVRQKIILSYTAGAYDELPTACMTAPVSMQSMAKSGLLQDMTDFLAPFKDKLVDGALEQMVYDGKVWGLPRSLRPNMLFYNNDIFEKYNIDPSRMDTIEGWIEVGRELKEKSNGTVFLSYIDPGSRTWRYYGRRGFMPQANARIWNDEGNVVIDTDPGARLAFETIETLYNEGLVMKSAIFKPPLYDATRNETVATYYIGAFWGEFLRKNLPDMEGKWRGLTSPMYKEIGTRGAPVINFEAIINTPDNTYAELYKKYWIDFNFNEDSRISWTKSMVSQNAPYPNPITPEMLNNEFWKEPSPYYGGQSFRQIEGQSLNNPSTNLRVTVDDAEADQLISIELEKFIAGDQTMDEAIINMAKNIKSKIGKTSPRL